MNNYKTIHVESGTVSNKPLQLYLELLFSGTCKLKQGMNDMAIPNKPTQHIVRYVQWCISIIPLIKISFPFLPGLTCSQIHGMSLNSFEQFLRHFCSRDWLGQKKKTRIRISTWPSLIKTVNYNPNRIIKLFTTPFYHHISKVF